MIKLSVEPGVGAVTQRAACGETSGSMARIAGGCEIRCVTGVALGRHGLEPAGCATLMAGIAIHRGMRTRQRESVVVLLHLLHRDLPSANRVALLTVRPQLTSVDVGVAILTVLPNT